MTKHPSAIALTCIIALAAGQGAHASMVVTGSSRAFDNRSTGTDFTEDPPEAFESGPNFEASGVAPGPYEITESILGFGPVSASSDVDGGSGVRFARASVDGPDFRFSLNINIADAGESLDFSLSITGLAITADVTGDFGSLVETGGVTFDTITGTLNGNDLGLSTTPTPNTVLVDEAIGGTELFVALNTQTVTGDGANERSIQVAGIVIETRFFDNGVLAAEEFDITGFAEASLTAVPEPGSLALLGLAGLALSRRRG